MPSRYPAVCKTVLRTVEDIFTDPDVVLRDVETEQWTVDMSSQRHVAHQSISFCITLMHSYQSCVFCSIVYRTLVWLSSVLDQSAARS